MPPESLDKDSKKKHQDIYKPIFTEPQKTIYPQKSYLATLFKSLFFFVYYPMRALLRSIVYAKPFRRNRKVYKPSDYLLTEVNSSKVKTKDGETIELWSMIRDKSAPTIVYFHGNAMNLASSGEIFTTMGNAGYNVVAFDYRGYGNSTGSPSENGLYNDADAVMKWLKQNGIEEKNTILMGESLGSGVATHIAYENPNFKALVLKSPFSSLQRRVPLWGRIFASDDVYDSASKIQEKLMNANILLLHDERDPVIHIDHSRRLLRKGKENANIKHCTVSGYGHNIPTNVTLEKMKEYLPAEYIPAQKTRTEPRPVSAGISINKSRAEIELSRKNAKSTQAHQL